MGWRGQLLRVVRRGREARLWPCYPRARGKRLLSIPTPVGVVATITAWNFPAVLPARKWGAALAAGCTVVGRPSELTPMSAMAIANFFVEAGVPPGVLNVVNGEPDTI